MRDVILTCGHLESHHRGVMKAIDPLRYIQLFTVAEERSDWSADSDRDRVPLSTQNNRRKCKCITSSYCTGSDGPHRRCVTTLLSATG